MYDYICYVRYDWRSTKFIFVFNVTNLCIIFVIAFCLFYSVSKLIIILPGKFFVSYAFHIPTINHKAPSNQISIAQRNEVENSTSPRIDTQNTLSVDAGIRGLISGSRACLSSGISILSWQRPDERSGLRLVNFS